jgi:hypothetical protein
LFEKKGPIFSGLKVILLQIIGFKKFSNSKNQVAKKGKKEKIEAKKQRNIFYELVRVQKFFFDFSLKK